MSAHADLQFCCQTGQSLALLCFRWSNESTRVALVLNKAGVALVLNKAAISVSRTFLKAILEPERVYFNTSLDERRREEDAERHQSKKYKQ